MKVQLFFGILIIFCMGIIGFENIAHAEYGDRPCSVSIDIINNIPIPEYISNKRSNPDGTVYPGDAIHFIFKYSGKNTCTSLLLHPLIGSDNMKFTSALIISDKSQTPKPHGIILYEWIPKYLTTTHWYEITGYSDAYRHNHHCKCAIHIHSDPILSDGAILSIREDQKLSKSDSKKISYYSKNSNKFLKSETKAWDLVRDETPSHVGVDGHVLEDDSSKNKFNSFVKSNCSSLPKYGGCVFGHIEINTMINDSKEICLFEELDRREIQYDTDNETDLCIQKDLQNKISLSVQGTGIKCGYNDNGNRKCTPFVRTADSSVAPIILNPYGDIFFKYLQLYDSDGFSFKNDDGTYYLNDVIGIHSIPDVSFKESRAGTISFDNTITQNTIKIISDVSCNDSICDLKLSGDKISPLTHETNNGDMISTHYTNDSLGLASIPHESAMYNLDRYIGVYRSTATPLVVCYDPVVSEVHFWSYLADAGNTSFDNRYAAAIKYDGSIGGCVDDPDMLHKDRRVKITDFFSTFVQSDNFGMVVNVTNPDVSLSNANSIADMNILDSVKDKMNNNIIADSYDGPILTINHTIQDVQINSAGFSRFLFDVSLDENYLEKNYIDVTVFNTFGSSNFGGADIIYLTHGTYDYPWGYFTTPFNVTAYKYVQETIPCNSEFCNDFISVALADTDVTINNVIITDSNNTSISLVDFYLNHHKDDDAEFSFMHLADLYEMNVSQNIDSHTGKFLLNKTAIYYDGTMQNYLFENFYGDYSNNVTSYDNPSRIPN